MGKHASGEREKLSPGAVIPGEKNKYEVKSLLGSGGFGDVYLVATPDGKTYAMKTEMQNTGNKTLLRLKMEVTILAACNKATPERRRYFVPFIDRGRTDKFKYLVMGLVGPSLDDIRRNILEDNFSKATAIRCCQQTLQAIWDLHDIGYLHRDIKPCNYAVGLEKAEQNTIYMLDFGIARKFTVGETRECQVPRKMVKFLGTVKYATRACHNNQEQGRREDLETWLYMTIDLFDDTALPWIGRKDKPAVVGMKNDFFKGDLKVGRPWPPEFNRVRTYIDKLAYADEPDYKFIQDVMEEIIKNHSLKVKKELDWAGKIKKTKTDKRDEDALSGSDSGEGNNTKGGIFGMFSSKARQSRVDKDTGGKKSKE